MYLIEEAKVAPRDINIYEEKEREGGAMDSYTVQVPPGGPKRPKLAYVLPATRVLEREYLCVRDLFSRFISAGGKRMWQDILDFNNGYPYNDTTRLLHEKDNKKGQDRLDPAAHLTYPLIFSRAKMQLEVDVLVRRVSCDES